MSQFFAGALGCGLGVTAVWALPASTNVIVRFEEDVYEVRPGQTFLVDIFYEPLALSGLYSYAINAGDSSTRGALA